MNYKEGIRRVSFINSGLVFLCFICTSFYQMDFGADRFTDVLVLLAFILIISLCPILFGKILSWSIKKSNIDRPKPSLYIALVLAFLSYVFLYLDHSSFCLSRSEAATNYNDCIKILWSYEKIILWLFWLMWASLAIVNIAVWIHKLYLWCAEGFLNKSK